jgi:hypothetical protein
MSFRDCVRVECEKRGVVCDEWVRIFIHRNYDLIACKNSFYRVCNENILSDLAIERYFERWGYVLSDSLRRTFLKCFYKWCTVRNGIYIWSQGIPELLFACGVKPEYLSSRVIFFACFWFQHIMNSNDEPNLDLIRKVCISSFINTFKKYSFDKEIYSEREMILFAFKSREIVSGENSLCVCRECGSKKIKEEGCGVCCWYEFEGDELEMSF